MKQLYLLLAVLIFQTSFAQDARLFENTWYLRTVQLDDLAPIYNVSEIVPPIEPYLIIAEDFSFNGEGACNIFEGTYLFNSPNYLTTTYFPETHFDCDMPIQNLFEMSYFEYISNEFWFDITQDGGATILTLGNALGGIAVFYSHPLSVDDYYKNEFTLFPNPAKSQLFLTSKSNYENLKVKIFNIAGKLISIQTLMLKDQTSIAISQLSHGLYFLNIEDKIGNTTVKKFLKE